MIAQTPVQCETEEKKIEEIIVGCSDRFDVCVIRFLTSRVVQTYVSYKGDIGDINHQRNALMAHVHNVHPPKPPNIKRLITGLLQGVLSQETGGISPSQACIFATRTIKVPSVQNVESWIHISALLHIVS